MTPLMGFCRPRTPLLRFAAVLACLLSHGQSALADRIPSAKEQRPFDTLLSCDLVARGTITSFEIQRERMDEAMPMWPITPPAGTTILVGHVSMTIEEVLRGAATEGSIDFLVYVSLSHVKANYRVGEQILVGLKWEENVLGGMYRLFDDTGRFVQTAKGWERQDGKTTIADLAGARSVLNSVAPQQVLENADLVVVGTLVRDEIDYRTSSDGHLYCVLTYSLSNLEILKGVVSEYEIVVEAIASGDYWPDWRTNSTHPRELKRGNRYCFFLRRTADGLVVLQGMNGAYELRDNALVLPGGRSVDLTIDEIRATIEE